MGEKETFALPLRGKGGGTIVMESAERVPGLRIPGAGKN